MVLIPRTVSPFSLWVKELIGAVLQTAHGQSPLPLGEGEGPKNNTYPLAEPLT